MSALLLAALEVGGKLIDKLYTSDAEKAAAQAELIRMAQAGEFKQIEALSASDAGQVQVNTEEAKSDSLFKSGWRPYIGWTCGAGLSYQFVLRPLFSWVGANLFHWQPAPSLEMESLMTLLFGMLGLGAYRTYERVKAK